MITQTTLDVPIHPTERVRSSAHLEVNSPAGHLPVGLSGDVGNRDTTVAPIDDLAQLVSFACFRLG
jgi:hypothetical protein